MASKLAAALASPCMGGPRAACHAPPPLALWPWTSSSSSALHRGIPKAASPSRVSSGWPSQRQPEVPSIEAPMCNCPAYVSLVYTRVCVCLLRRYASLLVRLRAHPTARQQIEPKGPPCRQTTKLVPSQANARTNQSMAKGNGLATRSTHPLTTTHSHGCPPCNAPTLQSTILQTPCMLAS